MKNCCMLEYSSNKINKVVNPKFERNKQSHTKNTRIVFYVVETLTTGGKRKTHGGSQPDNLSTNKIQSYRDIPKITRFMTPQTYPTPSVHLAYCTKSPQSQSSTSSESGVT